MKTHYDRLEIEHNHGHLVLLDVTIRPNGEYQGAAQHLAEGTVESGGQMSRLFMASNYRAFPVGERMTWQLFGYASAGRIQEGADGVARLSMVTCG
jgi:hypothetical protein